MVGRVRLARGHTVVKVGLDVDFVLVLDVILDVVLNVTVLV